MSFLAFAESSPATPPILPAKLSPVEYPLSCTRPAKTAFLEAWEALSNAHVDDARALFRKAVAADPKCVMARAMLGVVTPGPEGKILVDQALNMTARLSEIERLDLQALEASSAGNPERALAAMRTAQLLSPDIYLVNLQLAAYAKDMQKWDEMLQAAQRAAALHPLSGAAWNLVGYAYLGLKQYPEAIVAFKRYAQLSPNEPNAHDSLADALLANGQLDAALAEYHRAIEVSGAKFWISWDGAATVMALQGKWDQAREALDTARAAAIEPADKLRFTRWMAWTLLAEGRVPEALKAIEVNEREAAITGLDGSAARARAIRGKFLLYAGQYADAWKQFSALDRARLSALAISEGEVRELAIAGLAGMVEASSRLGRLEDSVKALARLEALQREVPGDLAGADAVFLSRGLVALEKNDLVGAIEALKGCSELADRCHLALAEAQERAGDRAAATDTRQAIVKANHRDAASWAVRAQAQAALAAEGKGVVTGSERIPKTLNRR